MSDVVMLVGMQASGKGTVAKKYIDKGYKVFNRDSMAKNNTVASLVGPFEAELAKGSNIVLDNTYATVEMRRPFIVAAQRAKVSLRCEIMGTSFADCQYNALLRGWDRYKTLFFDAQSIKDHTEAKKDQNIFPIAVLYRYRKEYETPVAEEGFSAVVTLPFVRVHKGTNKALILDFDQTLRDTPEGSPYKYPTKPSEVKLISPDRAKLIKQYADKGYILLGASNQSGIHKGTVTHADVTACFDETCSMLGLKIQYTYCPHISGPIVCYCRKPNIGQGVAHILKHNLDPVQCIMVGDQKTDESFARGLGVNFFYPDDFFPKSSAEILSSISVSTGDNNEM